MKRDFIAKATIDIEAPPSKVWKALIDPAQIKQYLFGTEAISDWKVGSKIDFKGAWDGKEYHDKGKIIEMTQDQFLKYTFWSSFSGSEDLPENYSNVSFGLVSFAKGTRLTLTQDNNVSEESKEHSEQNWNQVLNKLKVLLEKN